MTDTVRNNVMVGIDRVLLIFFVAIALLVVTGTPVRSQTEGNSNQPFPPDALTVAHVIAWSMEGVANSALISPVRFNNASVSPVTNPLLRDGGFRLVSTAIARYEKPGGSKARRVVAGLLLHRDPVGRYYSTMFEVDYRLFQDGSMVIDASTVEPVEAPVPATFVCFVPAEKVSRAVLSSGTFSKLFKHAMKNAVSRQQASKSDRSKKDYFVFSFFMDHLDEDAEVGLLISKEKEGISGNSKKTVTFQEHGWHVAYTRSSLALDGNHEIFFKVVYTPGGRVPTKQRRQIITAVFTSYSLTKQAQAFLAKRGYKPGPADGIMGKRTRRALEQFQKDERLVVDGKVSPGLIALLASSVRSESAAETQTAAGPTGVPERLKPKMWPNEMEQLKP